MILRTALAMIVVLASSLAAAATSPATSSIAWPTRPVRFIVPFPPGSSTDNAARVIAMKLSSALGQQVVIDNRAGASGNIGMETAARAAADGHTLVLGTTSTLAVSPAIHPPLSYNVMRDLAPVSMIGSSPYVIAVHPSVQAENLAQLIMLAKSKPGQIAYGSAGSASLGHLGGELFCNITGVRFNHVAYKSSALAAMDVLSGRVELQWGSISPTLPHIRSGKLRALATTGAKRVTALPEVPTVIEAGVRAYEVSLWIGVLVPAVTPPSIVDRLDLHMAGILEASDMQQALIAQGWEPDKTTPAAFAQRIRDETAKWRTVASSAGVRND